MNENNDPLSLSLIVFDKRGEFNRLVCGLSQWYLGDALRYARPTGLGFESLSRPCAEGRPYHAVYGQGYAPKGPLWCTMICSLTCSAVACVWGPYVGGTNVNWFEHTKPS